MMNKNHALCTFTKMGLKLVLIGVFSFVASFFVRAQQRVRVYYPFDNAVVNPAYLSNAEALSVIDSAFVNGSGASLEIVSYSSPEGNYHYNQNLSGRRAEALRAYLVGKYPQLAGNITVNPHAECWDDLRNNVEADSRLSATSKRDILVIIDSNSEADVKEASLKALPAYKALYSSYFRQLRYAEIRLGSALPSTADSSADSAADSQKAGSSRYTFAGNGVGFPLRGDVLDADFNGNAEALQQIKNLLAGRSAEEIASITIVSYASPEGPQSINERYSVRRAAALREYIVKEFPALAGKITVRSAGEAWEDFRSAVVADASLSEAARSEILSIIDSSAAADEKEAKLRVLPEWKHLFEDVFPGMRYANMTLETVEGETVSVGKPATTSETSATTGDTTTGKTYGAVSSDAILFDLNSVVVDPEFSSNPQVLDNLFALLDSLGTEGVESIEITAKTSPDGALSVNNRCAKQRGQAAYDYIVERYPELSGKITVRSAGEAWEDLRLAVESDSELSESSRSQILSIIVSNTAPDEKEAKLRERPEWDHLFNEVFPGLRQARVKVNSKETPVEPAVPVAEPAEITVEDEVIEVNDSLKVEDQKTEIAPMPLPALVYPRFAVSTNLAYDLYGVTDGFRFTPNISLEFPIGNKWSTYIEYTFPWWVSNVNNQAWQILKWDLGTRYWLSRHNAKDPMDILTGHFLGIDLGAGYYDIEPLHKGWQGEFQTVGLEYGYAWRLGRAWRLDAYAGAGWLGTHYRYYEGDSTDQHLLYRHHGKMDWFGPVKAGISIKYIVHAEKRRAAR